jgi:hypothetical protein
MKIALALWLCGLATALPAQSQKTFTSPDGRFRLHYPESLFSCNPHPGSHSPDSCDNQACSGPGSDSTVLACFAVPTETFKGNRQFVAAAAFVSEIKSATNQQVCLKGSQDWLLIKAEPKPKIINHVKFREFEIGDNWAGGGQDGPVYRTFHNAVCYELGIQEILSRAAYDPEVDKPLTKAERDEVQNSLMQVLNSFAFVK